MSNPGIDSVRALANAFGIKVSYFLDEDEPAASPAGGSATMAQPVVSTLEQRLNFLFEVVHPEGRGAFTDEEVAEAIAERGGSVTVEELQALREGSWDPSDSEGFGALADFFGVPVTYFTDDEIAPADLDRLGALKAVGARAIVMRLVNELDDGALEALVPLMERLPRAERRQRM